MHLFDGVFPLTKSDSDSVILSNPIIMETIKISRTWHTGSNSGICSDFNGYCAHFSDRKEYLNLNRAWSVKQYLLWAVFSEQ